MAFIGLLRFHPDHRSSSRIQAALSAAAAAARPNEKWVTDVTELNVGGEKLYLSRIMHLFNGEIVSYEIARRPLFNMVAKMLTSAFQRLGPR